jgi:hypothetical protein
MKIINIKFNITFYNNFRFVNIIEECYSTTILIITIMDTLIISLIAVDVINLIYLNNLYLSFTNTFSIISHRLH